MAYILFVFFLLHTLSTQHIKYDNCQITFVTVNFISETNRIYMIKTVCHPQQKFEEAATCKKAFKVCQCKGCKKKEANEQRAYMFLLNFFKHSKE